MPVVQIFQSIAKLSLQVTHVDELPRVTKRALTSLKTPRYGPVILDLPVNIQMSSFTKVPEICVFPGTLKPSTASHDLQHLFRNSKRPLFVFGHGVKLADCADQAVRCAEALNVPFTLSWGAFDICASDHPLRIGSHGVYGDRVANYAIQNCDFLIIVGSRMDSRQTGGNLSTFSKFSLKIMVDIDRDEMHKLEEKGVQIDYHVCEDAKQFLQNLAVGKLETDSWLAKIKDWKSKFSVETARASDGAVYQYLERLFYKLPEDAIVIPDQGGNLIWTMQSARIHATQSLFTNFGNSSMGFALPCAIGAAIGTKCKRPIYCIDGDGGFQMNVQELLTVSKYQLPVHVIILNNSGYGIIKQFQDSYFASNYVATSKRDVFGSTVEFLKLAHAYGCQTLDDVPIPETQKIYPKLEFGNSLENMTPYIDFEADMIVEVPPRKAEGWKSN